MADKCSCAPGFRITDFKLCMLCTGTQNTSKTCPACQGKELDPPTSKAKTNIQKKEPKKSSKFTILTAKKLSQIPVLKIKTKLTDRIKRVDPKLKKFSWFEEITKDYIEHMAFSLDCKDEKCPIIGFGKD